MQAGVLSHVMCLRGTACLLCLLSLSTLRADVAVQPKYVVAVSRRNATIADAGAYLQPCPTHGPAELQPPALLGVAPPSEPGTRTMVIADHTGQRYGRAQVQISFQPERLSLTSVQLLLPLARRE